VKECKNCDHFGLIRSIDGRMLKKYGECKYIGRRIKGWFWRPSKFEMHEGGFCEHYAKRRCYDEF
jgi:hypothetical protein